MNLCRLSGGLSAAYQATDIVQLFADTIEELPLSFLPKSRVRTPFPRKHQAMARRQDHVALHYPASWMVWYGLAVCPGDKLKDELWSAFSTFGVKRCMPNCLALLSLYYSSPPMDGKTGSPVPIECRHALQDRRWEAIASNDSTREGLE